METIDGVGDALVRMKAAGYRVFMHTNQSGIERGYYDREGVHACNLKMLELLGLTEDFFDGTCIAPEWPEKKTDTESRPPI